MFFGENTNMSNDLIKKQPQNILNVINNFISDIGLNDVKTYEWRSADDNAICYKFGKRGVDFTN